ncbi:DUF3710 domain-containing protein [Nocardioides ferulae]|uniref:DUF3710 domain-containing protein n=1 Tax=Nocardioides ferulae TaxID=2340821 RepID=UPI000EB14861|nr:DUF3710 domain-containing protein [Nocardioides ferulae]
MKFRRKSSESAPETAQTTPDEADGGESPSGGALAGGPFDADELPDDGVERVDLGALLIATDEKRSLRMQVDERTGEVQAVLLAAPEGALELRAFAAPRNGDLWSELRPQIAADMARRGGTATEREGRWGTELVCQLTVKRGEGTVTQPSRFIGINGSRWMLRATLVGRPAIDFELGESWEDAIARVAVRRGSGPRPVGDPLPVKLPEGAKPVSGAAAPAPQPGAPRQA